MNPNIYTKSYLVQTLQFRAAICRKKKKEIINIEFIVTTYFQMFPKHLTQLFCPKGSSSILNSYPQHMLWSSSTWRNWFCQKRNIWAYRCNFLIVILLIRLHEYTNHFSVYIKLSGHYFVLFKSNIPKCSEYLNERNIYTFSWSTICVLFLFTVINMM